MGAVDLDPTSEGASCMGLETLILLNEWFGNPHSQKFRQAKERNHFDKPAGSGDYNDLIDAYRFAGLDVDKDKGWTAYLKRLGTLDPVQGPLNIKAIAQLRDTSLRTDVGVRTTSHQPTGAGRVIADPPKGGNDVAFISSPYPWPP
jgi:hypothetical protein